MPSWESIFKISRMLKNLTICHLHTKMNFITQTNLLKSNSLLNYRETVSSKQATHEVNSSKKTIALRLMLCTWFQCVKTTISTISLNNVIYYLSPGRMTWLKRYSVSLDHCPYLPSNLRSHRKEMAAFLYHPENNSACIGTVYHFSTSLKVCTCI